MSKHGLVICEKCAGTGFADKVHRSALTPGTCQPCNGRGWVAPKTGESQYRVRFYENCGHSPAWPLVPRAMIDLEDRGVDFQPHVSPVWTDACMAAIGEEGKAIGFLIYRYDEVKCSWFIMLAYVAPEHRRKGIHTTLFSALVDRAKQRGDILSIDCGTHVNNTTAQAAFEAQGRAKTAIMYSFHLKDWADGKEPTEVAQ